MIKLTNKLKLVFLMVSLILAAQNAHAWEPKVRESMDPKSIKLRIQPLGEVDVDGDVAPAEDLDAVVLGPDAGKKRYDKSCAVCHGTGVAGAPKYREPADWKDRMGVGIDGLLASAIKGKGGMPPKGTCMSCSDEELKLSIEHMLPQ